MKNDNKYKPQEVEKKWPSDASTSAKATAEKKALAGKQSYNPAAIEEYWQKVWVEQKTYSPDIDNAKSPFYNLMMFPYPSAEGLHVGNMYAFTGADVYGRFKRMQGNDVFEPIGLDGFGIHSENYALKIGKHPKEQAEKSQENFYRQLKSIGNGFDLTRTLETYDPEYYKWTQWLFITLFKSGLAYRKKAEVNWCPSCLTVLSDEQVLQKSKNKNQPASPDQSRLGQSEADASLGGKSKNGNDEEIEITLKVCERCDTEVEQKELEQWFFRITDYAQRLLDNIEGLDWTERVKIAQRNWIGRSEGAEISFELVDESLEDNSEIKLKAIKVFTTRPDTLYGATFMVVSPEHELVTSLLAESSIKPPKASLAKGGYQVSSKVEEYVKSAKTKSDIERTAEGKNRTGVFSGLYAINPFNGKKIPVWVADYVLSGYGTGAIMAVPAHDQRDYEFAVKHDLPIELVIAPEGDKSKFKNQKSKIEFKIKNEWIEGAYDGNGTLVNSGSWDGLEVPKDIGKVIDDLEARGLGKRKVNFHLRDWLISRQRYWGPPIPMIFCEHCASEGKSWFTSEEGDVEIEARSKKQEASEKIHDSSFMLHDSASMAGWYPVPEADLPVLLPDVADWKPMGTGKAPLANHPEFYKTKCPGCGKGATRETDVSDTFLDSAWYFLRYIATDWQDIPFPSKKFIKDQKSKTKDQTEIENWKLKIENSARRAAWLPVNMYIGGAEHSVLHLLYSRFITMVLKDLGYLDFEEPFSKFYAHGLIIKDGAKMSKSKGNVVVPDEYIAKYGADSLRTYLMFIGPYSDGGDFRDSGIEGINRFLRRVWKLMSNAIDLGNNSKEVSSIEYRVSRELDRVMHRTIKGVTEDIENLRYNTAIAKLMEYYNSLNSFYTKYHILDTKYVQNFLLLLAPFAPHLTEELWQQLCCYKTSTDLKGINADDPRKSVPNQWQSIHLSEWSQFDTAMLVSDTFTIVVQVNGKRRAEIEVKSEKLKVQSEVEKMAKEKVSKYLEGLTVKKTIYVKGKIINFVV